MLPSPHTPIFVETKDPTEVVEEVGHDKKNEDDAVAAEVSQHLAWKKFQLQGTQCVLHMANQIMRFELAKGAIVVVTV